MIIFHIDVNSAFLSWSALKLLDEGYGQDIREIPSIVGGERETRHGIVLAKSVPAKKYGIHTAETVASAFKKCPNLVMVPPDHTYYREKSHALMEHLSSICPVIEQVSVDECYMDFEPIRDRFPDPSAAAYYIKDSVREKFGFTVNVGISDRKVLAKMASDFQKPDKVHTLYASEIRGKMWPLPVGELFMCGRSTAERFTHLGIRTIGDLAQMDPSYIEKTFKKHGMMLWRFANGIDESTVNPIPEQVKGVGNSTTLSRDVLKREDAFPVLSKLAESVSGRLQKKGFLAVVICVEIKYSDFRSVSHQQQLAVPTNRAEDIYQASRRLFDELWNGEPVRLLGIRANKIAGADEPRQMTLFEYEAQIKQDKKQKEQEEKRKKLDDMVSSIRRKFGDQAVRKG